MLKQSFGLSVRKYISELAVRGDGAKVLAVDEGGAI